MGARVGNHAENARQGASKNGKEEKLGYASLSKSIQGGVASPFPLFTAFNVVRECAQWF